MHLHLSEVTIVFFIFSFLGWCMEVFLKLVDEHIFVNRGFLIGPYCPVYGFGVIFIIFMIGAVLTLPYGIFPVFLSGMVICGVLEYFVSWFLEKRYHARWWDYSTKPLNIHGRVWIGNLILFGIASVVIMAGIYLGIEGDITGSIMFLLEKQAARHLVSKLMGMASEGEEFTEMEFSALKVGPKV